LIAKPFTGFSKLEAWSSLQNPVTGSIIKPNNKYQWPSIPMSYKNSTAPAIELYALNGQLGHQVVQSPWLGC
jgi:hypothetical protein